VSKVVEVEAALSQVRDGDVVLVGGFGDAGRPDHLLEALRAFRLRDLTIVSNNAGRGTYSLGGLIADGCVRRLVCSFPTGQGSETFRALLDAGKIEMDLHPQGVLTERLRAAASGVAAFFLPAPVGTAFERAEDVEEIDGVPCQRYRPLKGDVALVGGGAADPSGNVSCRLAGRNYNPVMARAARTTIVQVPEVVPAGGLDVDKVHMPAPVVDYVVHVPADVETREVTR
jgi:3-oxoadipate CoA-transferase alpha subunit